MIVTDDSATHGAIDHHVSTGHLERYCDEFAFRYENRKISDGDRATARVGSGWVCERANCGIILLSTR